MMLVPIQAVASQTVSVILGNQACQFNIYSKLGIVYMDVYVNNNPIILGVQCQVGNRIVRSSYLGFLGDLVYIDTQGSSDPSYSGLGSRWLLEYLDIDDLETLGFAA